ncbi:MAG TPA: HAMP domain-containing sensor histidine kinase [Jatrophihabitantaceae bacterium]
MTRPRSTLALRIALLTCAIAVITAVIAGGLAVRLMGQANERSARQTLSRLADAAQDTADTATFPQNGQARATRTLRALKIEFATISAAGRVVADTPVARDAVDRAEIDELLGGASLSLRRTVHGTSVLIEGRGTRGGAVVLVQRRADALAVGQQALRRVLLALLVAVAIAVLVGLAVAWRLARPLRRTADAARALASGRRDVSVHPEGPAEVADVADAMNMLTGALTHSEARQREFLMSISHDLRTPLTAISGYAESLADGVVPPEQAQRVGEIMLGESQRLARLVADLLDLARLDAQEFRVDLAVVDVAETVEAAGAVWASRCAAEGVRFAVERHAAPALATADPSRLRQALDGLLENALRVTPSGAPIVLAVRHERDTYGRLLVVAEVRDGGPGLSDADLAVAFDRSALYDRYRGVRRVGTGLGLAIVHGLVSRIGGTIAAGHAPEGGARFTIRLLAS